MKLQELLKIDTSKSNWFKIFARNGINVKTVSSVSNGGVSNSSKYAPRYFSIDFNVADEGWKYFLTMRDHGNIINEDNIMFNIGANYKIKTNAHKHIASYPFINDNLNGVETSFSYAPLYLIDTLANEFGIKGGFLTFEDIITNMPIFLKTSLGKDVTLSMKGITEITEEEFYKID